MVQILLAKQIKTIKKKKKPTELNSHEHQCKNSKQNTDHLRLMIELQPDETIIR